MPVLRSIIGQHFAYAYGRCAVLKQVLLSKTDVDRMLGAHDRNDVEKMMTELKFTTYINQSLNRGEEMLSALSTWVRNEVDRMSPDAKKPVFNILWLAGDTPVLSYLIKKHHGLTSLIGKEPDSALCAYGKERLRELIANGSHDSLPDRLEEFVSSMLNREDLTAEMIDVEVSRYVAETQLRLAKASGSTAILRYVKHGIDLRNVRTALRNRDDAADSLIEGGDIPVRQLAGGREKVLIAIDKSKLSYELSDAIEEAGDDPVALERACADVIAQDISHMWNVPMSIEPVFAFAAIALSNLALLRTILIGKNNDMSPQEIKKIIPPFIPAQLYLS